MPSPPAADPREAYIARRDASDRRRIPTAYRDATLTDARVGAWADEVITAYSTGALPPPPLLLLGPTGVGKTRNAYAAVRAISTGGLRADPSVSVAWKAASLPDLLAMLRPSAGPDPEGELMAWCRVPLLVIDDLGAERDTGWTSETLYRLLNYREAWRLPGIYTSNLPFRNESGPSLSSEIADQRIVSRLGGCRRIGLKGQDRRDRGSGPAAG